MLKPGQRLAQFEILEKLGEGGMGAVYLAQDRKLERRVAIKVLPESLVDDEGRRARFEREARTAARISHPCVMGIFDLGEAVDEETGRPLRFIVMEYVEGEPLHLYLRSHPLDMGEGLRLAEKLAAGLAAAHKLGIVHRDIKPENVVVNADGDPKILDFGLAKPTEPVFRTDAAERGDATQEISGDLTQAGRIVGTVNYMSPEQAQGGTVDTRSDIFSFGVLLYRIATGEAPFAGPTQVSTLAKIIEGRHASPRVRNAAVPPELERIIDKCLAKDPRDRYQDTRDLVVDLRGLRRQHESGVADSGGTFAPAGSGPSGERTGTSGSGSAVGMPAAGAPAASGSGIAAAVPRRPRRGTVLGGITAIAVVAALGGLLLRGGGSSAPAGERRLAVLTFENRTGDPELGWLETGLPEILVTDLARADGLALLSREKVNDHLRRGGRPGIEDASASDARKAATELGATAILTGSVFRVGGEQIRIDARLEEARSGRILRAEKVQGTDPMALVDSLTALVSRALAPEAAAPVAGSVTEITTASSEAFKHYHLGTEKFLLGLRDEARAEFGLAIAADTTFALAYMNLAVSYMFDGRAQVGAEFLQRAAAHGERLPARERAMLDIFTDLWIDRQYADAFAKLEGYVTSYPDDKRAAVIYGSLLLSFAADTTRAFAQFEAVLARDPGYPLALDQYAESLWGYREQARAIDFMQRFRRFHPDSPTPYARLGYYYSQQGKLAEALAMFEEFRRRFPGDPQVNVDMSNVSIRARDFARARALLNEMPRLRPDDPLVAIGYERTAANLDLWEGKFASAVDRQRRSVAAARALGDSLQISVALSSLASVLEIVGREEEALETTREAGEHLPIFNRLTYPISLAEKHPERADEARRLMREALGAFKERTPRELWNIADLLQTTLEATASRDTTALLDVFEKFVALPASQGGRGNRRAYAELLTRVGRHREALPFFEEFISGAEESAGAWSYLNSTYFAGVCLEGLGRTAEAKEKFAEVLRYWGNADIEVEPAREAKARLARLTS